MLVFGLDAAETSGWAILSPCGTQLVAHGHAKTPTQRAEAIATLADIMEAEKVLLVAYEEHLFGPRKTMASLNRSTGIWLGALEAWLPDVKLTIVSASPGTWRKYWKAPNFRGSGGDTRAKLKAWAITKACGLYGAPGNITDDEAEAMLIAGFAQWRAT